MTSAINMRRTLLLALAAIGLLLGGLVATSLVLDVRDFDRTRGGYEPPYTAYTGEPIDWGRLDLTATGMVNRGRVVNVLIDCMTGMMTLEAFGFHYEWRTFSPRALAVHAPREACRDRGFTPRF